MADVWVDGVRRVGDGRLVGHDLAALVEASRPWLPTWSSGPASAASRAWPRPEDPAAGPAAALPPAAPGSSVATPGRR